MDDRNKEPEGEAVFERCFCGEECSKDELCLCLLKNNFCGVYCPCESCWNNGENETEVVQLRKEIESRKALALNAGTPDTDISPIEVGPSEETQTDFQIQKCSCDNKQCSKNDCECYFLEVKCNESCPCNEDCSNRQEREVNKRSGGYGRVEPFNKRIKITYMKRT